MDAYNFIKEGIILGHYKPGMKLTEQSLAQELDMSRTPIREAIRQLTSEGLIIPLNRGISVRKFTENDIRQIYDLRAMLEGYAAGQAAIHRSETDLEKMQSTNIFYEQSIDQYLKSDQTNIHEIVKANQQFHEAMIKAANNEHLRFHISKVVVVPLIFRSFYWYSTDELKRSLYVHQTILQAIASHEAERARIATHEHIYQGRDHVLKRISKLMQLD